MKTDRISDKKLSAKIKIIILIFISVFLILFSSACLDKKENSLIGSNSNNFGYVTTDSKKCIYYTKVISNEPYLYSNIYKYDEASEIEKEILISKNDCYDINEMNAYITPYKDKVYFLKNFLNDSVQNFSDNIYYTNNDGTDTEIKKLLETDINCTFFQLYNDMIYYYDDLEYKIYKIKPDGTEKTAVAQINSTPISISLSDKYIYYNDFDIIYRVSLDGGTAEEFFNCSEQEEYFYVDKIIADGGYLYMVDDTFTKLMRLSISDKKIELLYKVEDELSSYVSNFNIYKGSVYFIINSHESNYCYSILRVTANTKNVSTIISESNNFIDMLPFTIWNDTIYFYACSGEETVMDSYYALYNVSVNGGSPILFMPRVQYSEEFGIEPEADITIEIEK